MGACRVGSTIIDRAATRAVHVVGHRAAAHGGSAQPRTRRLGRVDARHQRMDERADGLAEAWRVARAPRPARPSVAAPTGWCPVIGEPATTSMLGRRAASRTSWRSSCPVVSPRGATPRQQVQEDRGMPGRGEAGDAARLPAMVPQLLPASPVAQPRGRNVDIVQLAAGDRVDQPAPTPCPTSSTSSARGAFDRRYRTTRTVSPELPDPTAAALRRPGATKGRSACAGQQFERRVQHERVGRRSHVAPRADRRCAPDPPASLACSSASREGSGSVRDMTSILKPQVHVRSSTFDRRSVTLRTMREISTITLGRCRSASVSERTGVSHSALRYYEAEQLIEVTSHRGPASGDTTARCCDGCRSSASPSSWGSPSTRCASQLAFTARRAHTHQGRLGAARRGRWRPRLDEQIAMLDDCATR